MSVTMHHFSAKEKIEVSLVIISHLLDRMQRCIDAGNWYQFLVTLDSVDAYMRIIHDTKTEARKQAD